MRRIFFALVVFASVAVPSLFAQEDGSSRYEFLTKAASPLHGGSGYGAGKTFLAQDSIIGFFFQGPPGMTKRIALAREDDGYRLYFFMSRFHAQSRGNELPVQKKKIDDALGRNLERILKTEIALAGMDGKFGFDGVSFDFGVKENGEWKYAGAWCPDGHVPKLMGRIASSYREYDDAIADSVLAEIRQASDEIIDFYASDKHKRDIEEHLRKQKAYTEYAERIAQYDKERGIEPKPEKFSKAKVTAKLVPSTEDFIAVECKVENRDKLFDWTVNFQEDRLEVFAKVAFVNKDGKIQEEFSYISTHHNAYGSPDNHVEIQNGLVLKSFLLPKLLYPMINELCENNPDSLRKIEVAATFDGIYSKSKSTAYASRLEAPLQPLDLGIVKKKLKEFSQSNP